MRGVYYSRKCWRSPSCHADDLTSQSKTTRQPVFSPPGTQSRVATTTRDAATRRSSACTVATSFQFPTVRWALHRPPRGPVVQRDERCAAASATTVGQHFWPFFFGPRLLFLCQENVGTPVTFRHPSPMQAWTVRRARDAGTALRHVSKAADNDEVGHDRTNTTQTKTGPSKQTPPAPAPTKHPPIVALVTRRYRTSYVYCKRTNETVPCTSIRIADDTFDGLKVTLWRGHAGMDIGERRLGTTCRGFANVGTLFLKKWPKTFSNAFPTPPPPLPPLTLSSSSFIS